MKSEPFASKSEIRAYNAQQLQAFSRFNLVGARQDVTDFLAQFGRNNIFSQYTQHDIRHIDVLLRMLDWVIPKDTAEKVMTPTDWMLAVLGIYFHDAGLVVTDNEFNARSSSDFPRFRDSLLNNEIKSSYQERVLGLTFDERERFLYQEFVRTHHARRINLWITGETSDEFGVTREAAAVINNIVSHLEGDFRRDLAMVCESHHQDDLYDLSKYQPRRAYGSLDDETANLQYAAILLRTVDLLHVTRDRTPSVSFLLATPTDPKSAEEWAKQMAVVAVRPLPARDVLSGKVDPNLISDTVQVTAEFGDPLGYFALTSYLDYAEAQIKTSHQWAASTEASEGLAYHFPWRHIDTTPVKALNFESKQFVFQLDKPRILRLLTGHTLYSNSDVVLRELVQNSLDAIRLQREIADDFVGEISVTLDTVGRILTIDDNGTGMSQEIIENHFFNVGSSRYRDEAFCKQYPRFSAISRFGIGILSVFMISDEIEVLTKPANEKQVRNISIRSLNGKYLIRKLQPSDDKVPPHIRAHGTRIQLKCRPDVMLPNVVQVAQFWILFPGCKVRVQVDSQEPIYIGFESPKHALMRVLEQNGCELIGENDLPHSGSYKVEERTKDGLTIAMALRWQQYYQNWSVATVQVLSAPRPEQIIALPNAMCVQGIRVENSAPGFADKGILAVSNIAGPTAPATNVARSSLEVSDATDRMFASIYQVYAEYLAGQIQLMVKSNRHSMSEAASEGRYLLMPFLAPPAIQQCPKAEKILDNELRAVPWLTLDSGDTRSLTSVRELEGKSVFCTIESLAVRSAEEYLKKMPTKSSLARLVKQTEASVTIPSEEVIAGYSENKFIRDLVLETFEVQKIEIDSAANHANLYWKPISGERRWKNIVPTSPERGQRVDQLMQSVGRFSVNYGLRYRALVLQDSNDVNVVGGEAYSGLAGVAQTYIFKDNEFHRALISQFSSLEQGNSGEAEFAYVVVMINLILAQIWSTGGTARQRSMAQIRQHFVQAANGELRLPADVDAILESEQKPLFDPVKGDRYAEWYSSIRSGSID